MKSSRSRPKAGTLRPTSELEPSTAKDIPHYHGHRRRLRERFLSGGPEALADYELLEMLLFMGIPRIDTKPLAKALIARFGSFADVVAAPITKLKDVEGMSETAIAAVKLTQAAALKLARAGMVGKDVISSWDALIDSCAAGIARAETEEFHVLFLDRKNILITDEVHQRGTVDHTPVYPREVVKRALEVGASALILVHNHPSGDPAPSRADIAMTREIVAAAKALKIEVHDHLVIGRGRHASFKALGLL
jgi:DNA repair protein RadC